MKLHRRGSLVRSFQSVIRMVLMHECSAGDPLGTAGVHQRMGQSGLGQELEDNPNVMSMMVHVIKYLFIYLLRFTNNGRVNTTVHGANYFGPITVPPSMRYIDHHIRDYVHYSFQTVSCILFTGTECSL